MRGLERVGGGWREKPGRVLFFNHNEMANDTYTN